ncbi:MAG: hypothetical protein WCR21_00085 [Bacteroidota bacterium]
MTKRQVLIAKTKIDFCKKEKNNLEALIRIYHLNMDLLCFIVESSIPNLSLHNKKNKEILELFSLELEVNSNLKTIISKKSSKPIKAWFKQMDVFIKALKRKVPQKITVLMQQGESNFLLLNMSANKLFLIPKKIK